MHSKKDVRRINQREDYEKSGFKGVMNDLNKDKEEALDYVPEIILNRSRKMVTQQENYY